MTRVLAVAVLAAGLMTAAADDKAPKVVQGEKVLRDPKAELERFAGTWLCVSAVRDGKEVPKDEAAKIKLLVTGDHNTLTEGGETIEGTHKLDPTKTPKEIDAVRTNGAHKGEKLHGVYMLSEDSYMVSFAAPGKDRPKELKAEGGLGLRVLAFKRDVTK